MKYGPNASLQYVRYSSKEWKTSCNDVLTLKVAPIEML